MATFDELTQRVARQARLFPVHQAARWVRAVASVLADWGGEGARRALQTALPDEALRGPGTGGLPWDRACALAAANGEGAVLTEELARRAREPDPTKAALTAEVVLRALTDILGADGAEAVADALPAVVGARLRAASPLPPWPFRLIPQSYARPE